MFQPTGVRLRRLGRHTEDPLEKGGHGFMPAQNPIGNPMTRLAQLHVLARLVRDQPLLREALERGGHRRHPHALLLGNILHAHGFLLPR